MAKYTYTGNTKQLGANHQNFLAALKVDPTTPTAPVTVLAQTQAASDGSFTLEWGTDVDAGSEDWAGRICVLVLDDAEASQKMKSASNDWLVGVLDNGQAPTIEEGQHWRLYITANNGDAYTTAAEITFYDETDAELDTSAVANAISSSEANSANSNDYAFDKTSTNQWASAAGESPSWIGFGFAAAVKVTKVKVMGHYASGGQAALSMKDFKVQRSTDGGTTWLDVGNPIVGQTGWGAAEERTFVVQS